MDEIVEPLVARADRPFDIPLNVAVWISFKPILKIYLSIGTGFLLAKLNILTPELSKGISRLVLIVFLPCLIFNNIVSQIKDTDIKLLGVVVFTGFIYYTIGLGWGFIIRLVTPIPRAWFGGLLLCCMLNNCSDLPLAYVQTIGNSPLLPDNVASKGQSYCVLFSIIFIIFNFNLGGTRLVEWDATRIDPRREEPTVPPVSWEAIKAAFSRSKNVIAHPQATAHASEKHKKKGSKESSSSLESKKSQADVEAQNEDAITFSDHEDHVPYNAVDPENYIQTRKGSDAHSRARSERHFGSTDVFYARTPQGSFTSDEGFEDARSVFQIDPDSPLAYQNLARHMSRTRSRSIDSNLQGSVLPTNTSQTGQNSITNTSTQRRPSHSSYEQNNKQAKKKSSNPWKRFKIHWFKFKSKNGLTTYICNFCEDLFLPQMLSLISGITVAMIPWVRRVFSKGQDIEHFHDAPDQMPPLSFLMDFLDFFAGAQVPLGLMLLGGTIASLRVGKMVKGFWKSLILIVVFKLAILPIIGCAWISRIREIGWIDKNDPIVPIVLAVAAATPSATVQIYLTLSWIDPTKESVELNCLALSLVAQYLLLPISLTFMMTYVVMHFV